MFARCNRPLQVGASVILGRFWFGGVSGLLLATAAVAQVLELAPVSQSFTSVDGAFPDAVRVAVLQAAAAQSGIPLESLSITQAEPKLWSDGCLALGRPDEYCAAVLVRGWAVMVTHKRQEWGYRTNASGSVVLWDRAAGRLSQWVAAPADPLSPADRPVDLEKSVVFHEVQSGGLAGTIRTLTLYKDGRLVQTDPADPEAEPEVQARLPKTAVKDFRKTLAALHFGQFDGLHYPAPTGAADGVQVTLSDRQTVVQFNDIALPEAPADLQQVVKVWRSLTQTPPVSE